MPCFWNSSWRRPAYQKPTKSTFGVLKFHDSTVEPVTINNNKIYAETFECVGTVWNSAFGSGFWFQFAWRRIRRRRRSHNDSGRHSGQGVTSFPRWTVLFVFSDHRHPQNFDRSLPVMNANWSPGRGEWALRPWYLAGSSQLYFCPSALLALGSNPGRFLAHLKRF